MITRALPFLALSAAVALAACGQAETPSAPTEPASADKVMETEKTVVFKADGKTGELGIDLPGGTGASLRLPPDVVEKMGADSKMDIDGVGLYPGARVTAVEATSREGSAGKSSTATIRFTAPSSPEAVAEWYAAAFRDKGHKAVRSGNRVEGTTTEGSSFALDLVAEGDGSTGTLEVTETK